MRLWLPQIFQAMTDYLQHNNSSDASICIMLEVFQPAKANATLTDECIVVSLFFPRKIVKPELYVHL